MWNKEKDIYSLNQTKIGEIHERLKNWIAKYKKAEDKYIKKIIRQLKLAKEKALKAMTTDFG